MNLQTLEPASLLKGNSNTDVFLWKIFSKFLRTPILKNNWEWLLLYLYYNSHHYYHHHHFHYICKTPAQKIKFSVKDFSRKRDQIRSFLRKLNWTTLDNVETAMSFSTSILTTLGNVETTLRIWPFEKKLSLDLKTK